MARADMHKVFRIVLFHAIKLILSTLDMVFNVGLLLHKDRMMANAPTKNPCFLDRR